MNCHRMAPVPCKATGRHPCLPVTGRDFPWFIGVSPQDGGPGTGPRRVRPEYRQPGGPLGSPSPKPEREAHFDGETNSYSTRFGGESGSTLPSRSSRRRPLEAPSGEMNADTMTLGPITAFPIVTLYTKAFRESQPSFWAFALAPQVPPLLRQLIVREGAWWLILQQSIINDNISLNSGLDDI